MKYENETKQAIQLYSELSNEVFYGFNMKHILTDLFTNKPEMANVITMFVRICKRQREEIYDKKKA